MRPHSGRMLFLLSLIAAVGLLAVCHSGPLRAEPVSQLVYDRSAGTSPAGQLTFWLGSNSLKMELVDEEQTLSMIYRSAENPPALYLLDPEQKQARKVTRKDVQSVATFLRSKYEQMQKMIQNIPPAQRQRMKHAMPFESPPDPTPPPEPTLDMKRSLTWQGRAAREGTVRVGTDSAGRIVLLDEPVMEVTPSQKDVLKGYQSLLDEWIGLLGSLPTREDTRNIRSPGNRLSTYFPRMAEYEHENTHLVLVDWKTIEAEKSPFEIPDSYGVESIGSMIEGGSNR